MLEQLNEQSTPTPTTVDKSKEVMSDAPSGTKPFGRSRDGRHLRERKKPSGFKKPTAAKSEFEEKLVT